MPTKHEIKLSIVNYIMGTNTVSLASPLIGPPPELSLSGNLKENLKIFKRKFEFYVVANSKIIETDVIKTALLHSCIGDDAHDLLESLSLTDKAVTQIFAGLEAYCTPKTNVIVEQFNFFQRSQRRDETFDRFLLELRKLVKTCEFGDLANNLLKVRIILGLKDKPLQERLLRKPEVTLDNTIKIYRAVEIAKESQATVTGQREDIVQINSDAVAMIQAKQFNPSHTSMNNSKKSFGFQNRILTTTGTARGANRDTKP